MSTRGAFNPKYQCRGKRQYTRQRAKAVLGHMKSDGRKIDRSHMSVYHCPHCGYYHIGHTKSSSKQQVDEEECE
jgi:predicted RNA-binding Zn-ribbon protein involved in translation (DUF1610 family)